MASIPTGLYTRVYKARLHSVCTHAYKLVDTHVDTHVYTHVYTHVSAHFYLTWLLDRGANEFLDRPLIGARRRRAPRARAAGARGLDPARFFF